ncbi:MAG TPA: glycine oxidase ThiO [Thermomicrobiales bacterium]|nr:glycine oxidase ThiO [Thermomicrobiales bacterium]
MGRHERSSEVVIVGGGIIGCALAWELAKAGVTTRVLERREIAREASWSSAGIISPPGPRHGTRAELALRSFLRYPALIAEVEAITGHSVGYVTSGEIDLATDETGDALRQTFEWQKTHGLAVEMIDGPNIRDREPAIQPDFVHGIVSSDAGSLILSRMAAVLARAASLRGASIVEHTPITGIVVDRGRATGVRTFDAVIPAGAVVIAAGAWSRMLGESLDFSIPTVPVKGQMLSIADPPIPLRAVVAADGGYFVPRADRTIAVGATEEPDAGFDTGVTLAGVAWLTDLVGRVAPSLLEGRLHDTWAGLRPGVEDGEPIIGRVPHLDNVWIATGHFRSGALLAPATAQALAASIISGQPDPLLAPFDPVRLVS